MTDMLKKQALLGRMLQQAPFEGWTDRAFRQSAAQSGMSLEEALRLCPGGAMDLLVLFCDEADRAMLKALSALHPGAMKTRERVAAAVMLRLDASLAHREAVRRAVSIFALPQNAALSLRTLYRTVDAIWYGVGDRSADFSFYTKRLLLAGVYSSTLLVWLDDRSPQQSETRNFLHRRIDDVMWIGKTGARAKRWMAQLETFTPAIFFRQTNPTRGA